MFLKRILIYLSKFINVFILIKNKLLKSSLNEKIFALDASKRNFESLEYESSKKV
jgi:hypothetical protein